MNFAKSLKTRIGQATLEYFLIFAVVIGASALSTYVFWPRIRDAVQGSFFPRAAARIENADRAGFGSGLPFYWMPRNPFSVWVTSILSGVTNALLQTVTANPGSAQPYQVIQATQTETVEQQCERLGGCMTLVIDGVEQTIRVPTPSDTP